MDKILKYYADLIFRELGIVYSDANAYQLENRLREISQKRGYANREELFAKTNLLVDQELKELILDQSTNNETLFFRDREIFEMIIPILVEPVHLARPTMPYKIWSCACSTGQEVYSLAIMLEELKRKHHQFKYRMLATDYSKRVLAQAEAGEYANVEVERGLSATELSTYFQRNEREKGKSIWRVSDQYRRHIDFRQLNLKADWQRLEKYDLILCRNVLIYQNQQEKQKILTRLYDRLVDGGHLVLGCAENIHDLDDFYQAKMKDKFVYYEKKAKGVRAVG